MVQRGCPVTGQFHDPDHREAVHRTRRYRDTGYQSADYKAPVHRP